MLTYTRLTCAEREEISRLVAAGASLRAIARQISRAPSTISRELHRTGKRRLRTRRHRYRALPAHQLAASASQARRRPRRLMTHAALRAYVHRCLAQRWSPEQIATRLQA